MITSLKVNITLFEAQMVIFLYTLNLKSSQEICPLYFNFFCPFDF